MHGYDRFHMHTQTKYKVIALSLRSHHRPRSPLQLSLFLCRQLYNLRPACRLQNGISESVLEIKPSLPSDVLPPSIYSTVPTSLTLYATLGPPPLLRSMRHPTSILSPILRQKWSPRAKWHRPWLTSRPPTGLTTLLSPRVSQARKVVGGGMM